jgi:NDP-sugar pyrophosphorylase family protein
MKAMILAAGHGTRLRPLTDDRPKALVELRGRTLLEIALHRLRSFGINEVIVNVHHFSGMIVEYLRAHDHFGMEIEISQEEDLLDTGGGLKKAEQFFLRDSAEEPFILHNVDVLSSIDLAEMVEFHRSHHALATLAVQHRKGSRQLLFDEHRQLCGRRTEGDEGEEIVRSSQQMHPLAFCGIHVISPRIFALMHESHAFPIIAAYLRMSGGMAGEGENIQAFCADQYYWRDIGTQASLEQAAEDMEQKVVEL